MKIELSGNILFQKSPIYSADGILLQESFLVGACSS